MRFSGGAVHVHIFDPGVRINYAYANIRSLQSYVNPVSTRGGVFFAPIYQTFLHVAKMVSEIASQYL